MQIDSNCTAPRVASCPHDVIPNGSTPAAARHLAQKPTEANGLSEANTGKALPPTGYFGAHLECVGLFSTPVTKMPYKEPL